LGYTFRSHERVGYNTGFNKFMLTKKMNNEAYKRTTEYFLKLIKEVDDTANTALKIGVPIESEEEKDNVLQLHKEKEEDNPLSIVEDEEEFLLIVTDIKDENDERVNFWNILFDCFVGTHFVVWNLSGDEILESFLVNQDDKNQFSKASSIEAETFQILVEKCKGVLSDSYWGALFTQYFGKESFAFVQNKYQTPMIGNFTQGPNVVKLEQTEPLKIITEAESISVERIDEVIDFIHSRLKL
jgi:hypothetical protein